MSPCIRLLLISATAKQGKKDFQAADVSKLWVKWLRRTCSKICSPNVRYSTTCTIDWQGKRQVDDTFWKENVNHLMQLFSFAMASWTCFFLPDHIKFKVLSVINLWKSCVLRWRSVPNYQYQEEQEPVCRCPLWLVVPLLTATVISCYMGTMSHSDRSEWQQKTGIPVQVRSTFQ